MFTALVGCDHLKHGVVWGHGAIRKPYQSHQTLHSAPKHLSSPQSQLEALWSTVPSRPTEILCRSPGRSQVTWLRMFCVIYDVLIFDGHAQNWAWHIYIGSWPASVLSRFLLEANERMGVEHGSWTPTLCVLSSCYYMQATSIDNGTIVLGTATPNFLAISVPNATKRKGSARPLSGIWNSLKARATSMSSSD